jgi:hypothetical protein
MMEIGGTPLPLRKAMIPIRGHFDGKVIVRTNPWLCRLIKR